MAPQSHTASMAVTSGRVVGPSRATWLPGATPRAWSAAAMAWASSRNAPQAHDVLGPPVTKVSDAGAGAAGGLLDAFGQGRARRGVRHRAGIGPPTALRSGYEPVGSPTLAGVASTTRHRSDRLPLTVTLLAVAAVPGGRRRRHRAPRQRHRRRRAHRRRHRHGRRRGARRRRGGRFDHWPGGRIGWWVQLVLAPVAARLRRHHHGCSDDSPGRPVLVARGRRGWRSPLLPPSARLVPARRP